MSYKDRLNARMKAKRAKARAAANPASPDAEAIARIGEVHPNRYPKHADPMKGQVFMGECNTTRCDNMGAIMFNRGTYGLYCTSCGRGQNNDRPGFRVDPVPISVPVTAKPTIEEMEAMNREMHEQMRSLAA